MPRRYRQAIKDADMGQARAIVRDYDMPLFDFMTSFTDGWNAAIHGALELFGVAERWRRPPDHSLDDADMERLH